MNRVAGRRRGGVQPACLAAVTLAALAAWLPAQQSHLSLAEGEPQNAPDSPANARQAAIPGLAELDWTSLGDAARQAVEPTYERAQAHPQDPAAVGLLAMTLQAYGKRDAAADGYRRAAALAPEAFRWIYGLATVEEAQDHREEAMAALRAALKLRPDYAPAHALLGDLLRLAGDAEAAEKSYQAALQSDPELPTAHLGLGRLRERQQDWESAVRSYQRACELAGDFATAHYALGLAYRKLGKTTEAETSLRRYQELRERPAPVFDPFLEAVASLRGDTPRARTPGQNFTPEQKQHFVSELEEALAANPQLVWAHSNLIALYWQAGQPQKAEEHYRKAIEIDPNYAKAHYNWGSIELLRGHSAEAAAAFEKALAADPHHADALVQSGLLLEHQGQIDEAVRRYQLALEANPVHRQAHFLLARSLVRAGHYQEAVEHLEETIRANDAATPRYMMALASTYLKAGDRPKALETLRDARQRAADLHLAELAATIDRNIEQLEPAAGAP
jgi:tetratricopeptide (TPR) repeat protein